MDHANVAKSLEACRDALSQLGQDRETGLALTAVEEALSHLAERDRAIALRTPASEA